MDSSFSINSRLWNQFGAGPFPLDNIELADQTVLFVEGGRMSRVARRFQPGRTVAYLAYGDTTDQLGTYFPYPSTHNGQMAVVAADGHGVLLNVAHYTSHDGLHDRLYGRIGAGIYNWNGGHPNGETDRPPKE